MKFSVTIPAYKGRYLAEAIESVLAQTYTDFELIIVDDCSPEDLKGIVDQYDDPRIQYYRNEKNLGGKDPGENWNKCLSFATGEMFCLLCDDDRMETEFLSTMIELADKNPSVNIFRSRVKVIDQHGSITDIYPSSPQYETSENYMMDLFAGYRKQTITEFAYRTNYIKKQGGYSLLPKAMCADHLSIIKLSKNGGIASTNKCLISFRASDINLSGNGMNSKNILEKIVSRQLYTKEILNLIKDTSELDNLLRTYVNRQHISANAHELTYCSLKELIYLLKNRKRYDIRKESIKKGIITRLKNIIKGHK